MIILFSPFVQLIVKVFHVFLGFSLPSNFGFSSFAYLGSPGFIRLFLPNIPYPIHIHHSCRLFFVIQIIKGDVSKSTAPGFDRICRIINEPFMAVM